MGDFTQLAAADAEHWQMLDCKVTSMFPALFCDLSNNPAHGAWSLQGPLH